MKTPIAGHNNRHLDLGRVHILLGNVWTRNDLWSVNTSKVATVGEWLLAVKDFGFTGYGRIGVHSEPAEPGLSSKLQTEGLQSLFVTLNSVPTEKQ